MPQDAVGRRVCFREFSGGRSSWRVAQELLLKPLPCVRQLVPGEEVLKLFCIQHARFNELQQAGFIFGASGLERNSREVLGGKDARGCASYVFFHSLGEGFRDERGWRGKELHWPAGNNDVFALHRRATGFEVIENGLRAGKQTACIRLMVVMTSWICTAADIYHAAVVVFNSAERGMMSHEQRGFAYS